MKDFLKHFIKETVGDVLDERGVIIGKHDGATFLTLGARHGFTITQKGTHNTPYYVIAKDVAQNTITVSHEPLRAIKGKSNKQVAISKASWTRGVSPKKEGHFTARVRYRQLLEQCTIIHAGSKSAEILFTKPQIISSGQSLVLYNRDECLGGGVIE